jgi:transposase InsO family protein
VRYAFIERHARTWPISFQCQVLGVSVSFYHQWRRRKNASGSGGSRLSNTFLLAYIQAIFTEVRGAYGWPRMYRELRTRGLRVGKERIRKLMKENGLQARARKKFRATTDSNHSLPVSPNLLKRNFQADAPNKVWTGDITYCWTGEGWLYLAVIIDLFSRQVVGFAMSERMTRRLVIDALRMAWFRRRPSPGLIFHSDRGSQYASGDFQRLLKAFGMRGSMSRKGDCWDNAVTETLFGSLKVEWLAGLHFPTRRAAKDEIMSWLTFYNHKRQHSTLGYVSPMEFEKIRLAQPRKAAA